jgi:hypothetical protein
MSLHRVGVLALVFVTGCHSLWADDDLVGSGRLVVMRPAVTSFTSVEVDNSFAVVIAIGDPEIVITLDDNIVAAGIVQAEVDERGVLAIRQCDDCRDFAPSAGAAIRLASPRIDTIRATGEVTVSAETDVAHVVLEASGETRLAVTARGARSVSATANDLSTLALAGTAVSLTALASGEATLGSTAATSAIDVVASDLARVRARATDSAAITASGGATVVIAGEPVDRIVHRSDDATVTFSE